MIPPGFSSAILPPEKSADKQKSSSPIAGKQILICLPERQSRPPSASLPDKVDYACDEKAPPLRALLNVEQYRVPLRFANTPLPMFEIQLPKKRAGHRLR